jgi:hypothetical protein
MDGSSRASPTELSKNRIYWYVASVLNYVLIWDFTQRLNSFPHIALFQVNLDKNAVGKRPRT